MYRVDEKVQKAREERKKLIERAAKGDKKAIEILSKPPYFMKVYSEPEKEAYQKSQEEENSQKPNVPTKVKKAKAKKRRKRKGKE